MNPPSTDAMPSWYVPLSLRAFAAELPDQDIRACLEYVDKLRRERDRLLTQLTALRATREAPGTVLLDRVEAVLDYLGEQLLTVETSEAGRLITGVTGRLSGRVPE